VIDCRRGLTIVGVGSDTQRLNVIGTPLEKGCMTGYRADWVGAIAAGVVATIVFSLSKIAFPRLTGVSLYLVLGLLIAVVSLFVRELLRQFGI
jgi:hypothetical protein